ncbi:hypothetical protein [Candidatus Colwellia aromaticivorans]|uniref:hypothetical protein n=1 Tax=Candidatus Colwellia aromaticivorans TaxID=2267621 RepID=UPI001FEA4D64|nr:hypothetical protein [Candidatus Colwellia aromaticivorans]
MLRQCLDNAERDISCTAILLTTQTDKENTMTKAIEQQLIENISVILKKSLTADATLADLREKKVASFEAVFKKEAGFTCSANTFQPYIQEIADDFLHWQENKTQQQLLIPLVKKIEQLFTVLAGFEQSHSA